MKNSILVWGTGVSAERFYQSVGKRYQIEAFIDSKKTGEIFGKQIIFAEQGIDLSFQYLVICSSFFSQIIPKAVKIGYKEENIFIYNQLDNKLLALSEFVVVSNKDDSCDFLYVPWLGLKAEWEPSLSNDIVFPDAYKELVKSVAYVFISSVEGDFAEFGTCSGYSSSIIAKAINYYVKSLAYHEEKHKMHCRQLHLFDSFEGFPKATLPPDLQSPHVMSSVWGEGTAKGLNDIQLLSLCGSFLPKDRIKVYKGWYKDTLNSISDNIKFAFVHMDCDLYESTYDVLYYLLDKQLLSEGATILFDNWFCNKASKQYGEQKAWRDICEKFDIEYSNLGLYACVGNKIIIHGYKKITE